VTLAAARGPIGCHWGSSGPVGWLGIGPTGSGRGTTASRYAGTPTRSAASTTATGQSQAGVERPSIWSTWSTSQVTHCSPTVTVIVQMPTRTAATVGPAPVLGRAAN
jgi:hypothetical protein